MKPITCQDIVNILASYNARNKRLFGKERRIAFLEKKYQNCEGGTVFSDNELLDLYKYVNVSLGKMLMKPRNRNGRGTASFTVFQALHQLLLKTTPVIQHTHDSLMSEFSASFKGGLYSKSYFLRVLSETLSACGINSRLYIMRANEFQNTSNLCHLLMAIQGLSPIIRTLSLNDDRDGEIAYQFLDCLFEMGLAYRCIIKLIEVFVSQLFLEEYSRLGANDNIQKQKFLHDSLLKLSENDKEGILAFVNAVMKTDDKKLEQLLTEMNAPQQKNNHLSLAGLIKHIEAVDAPAQRFRR